MGYTQEDKRGFQLLHSFAFVIHLISCVFAYHLIPPSSKMKQYVYVEAVEFTITATGEPTIDIQKKSAFDNANAIAIIALNELLATVSHGIALSILTCNCCGKANINSVYRGRSRKEEYWRRWFEYGITAGILEVGMLVGQGELNLIVLISVLLANAAMQMIGFYNDYIERDKWNIIPSISAFLIMFSIIILFIFKAANQSSDNLKSLNYWYLALIFSIFYLSFGVHQMIYLLVDDYAKKVDVDKIYIVLGFTSKIILSWTYIAISRGTWDELDKENKFRFDDKVSWEGTQNSVGGWDTVKYGVLIASVFVISGSYILEYTQKRPTNYEIGTTDYKAVNTSEEEVKSKYSRKQFRINF